MFRAAAVVVVLAACGRAHGIDDRDLGDLVVAPSGEAKPIDVALAAKDPAELSRALALPDHAVAGAVGAHALSIATTTTIDAGGQQVSQLTDRVSLELGEHGAFHATYANSADYGREVVFSDGALYLRPRYQRWHRRAPETPDEPEQLRDRLCDGMSATWDLFGFAAQLSDRGTSQVAGRPARSIGIALASGKRTPETESLDQRKWRESRHVDALSGEVALDAATGVPLAVKLDGTLSYTRDGRPLSMHVTLDASLASIGKPSPVTAPTEDVVATPERLREVDDRDFLLQGIAPPLRKEPPK
jgi:hypothetical protein